MGHEVIKGHHTMLLKECCMMTLIMTAKETKRTCATKYTTLKGFRRQRLHATKAQTINVTIPFNGC